MTQALVTSKAILAILFRLFWLLAPQQFYVIWPSNLLTSSLPDEACYSRNGSCALN